MSHADRSKKQDKRLRDGYEPIVKCQHDCEADVFYSHEVRQWLEPRTRYVHSKLRCNTIKQSRKVAQHEKNVKTLRPFIIQELKSEIASSDPGDSLQKILFETMVRRKFEIDKVTIKELAASFYPLETYRSLIGDVEPTAKGIERMRALLSSLRKHPDNRATLIYSKKFENGEWYYYNLQTEDEYKKVEDRLIKQRDGIDETLEINEKILAETPAQRKKAVEELRKALESKKKKKREGGN